MTQQIAKLNNLRMAPRKVRLVANVLKGLSAQEAEAQLILQRRRAAPALLKLLRSALANAKNGPKLNPEQLFVKSIIVNGGPMLKRYMPRAMGRAAEIQKKTSHITLVLEQTAAKLPTRFIINPPEKKRKESKTKATKPKNAPVRETYEKPKEQSGLLKRLFRRKVV